MTQEENKALWGLAARISEITGVVLGAKQEAFIKTRLQRRMRELGLQTYVEYQAYVKVNLAEETAQLISILTTHHTYFFREIEHFNHMAEVALPQLVAKLKQEGRSTLRIWSAACSFGHEAYSIAMYLEHHLKKFGGGFSYEIMGSDVSEEAVNTSREGVYKWQHLKEAPALYVDKHWIQGHGDAAGFVKARDTIRAKCEFKVVNLKTLAVDNSQKPFDLIFCRNVFIYFTSDDVKQISTKLLNRLSPDGYLYLGVSESLHGLGLPAQSHGNSIYSHKNQKVEAAPVPKKTAPIRVLCVDDSPSILTLLKNVFSGDGFEVAGTASNGIEAHNFLSRNKVDLVTLDIHMPEMNGVEYIKTHYNAEHPPVIIVSSVVREDAELAAVALKAGISDYVEKPSLQNFNHKKDELRGKARSAVEGKRGTPLNTYGSTKRLEVSSPEKKVSVIYADVRDVKRVEGLIAQMGNRHPAVILLIENLGQTKFPGHAATDVTSLSLTPKQVFYLPLSDKNQRQVTALGRVTSHMALSSLSASALQNLTKSMSRESLLVEEGKNLPTTVIAGAKNIVPITSLVYESIKILEDVNITPTSKENGFDDSQILTEGPRQITKTASTGTTTHSPTPTVAVAVAVAEKFQNVSLTPSQALVMFSDPLGKIGDYVVLKSDDPNALRQTLSQFHDKFLKKPLLSKQIEAKYVAGARFNEGALLTSLKSLKLSGSRGRQAKENLVDIRMQPASGRMQVNERTTTAKKPPTQVLRKCRVLIVEDSATMRTILKRALSKYPDMEVVGEVEFPSRVAESIRLLKPDVMTLDMQLPEMTGAQLLKTLPEALKIPTLIVSSLNPQESTDILDALEHGAFDFVQKPSHAESEETWQLIHEKLTAAARGRSNKRTKNVTKKSSAKLDLQRVIAIGSSTGGTTAIKNLFDTFPREIPPIVIAQHIPPYFSKTFADRLNAQFPYEVKEAVDGDQLLPNRVLVAPGGFHMTVVRQGNGLIARITKGPPVNRHHPSVEVLFDSVAQAVGASAIGVILTGMGNDGAKGLLNMRKAGCHTIGQNEESCVVYGMPKVAMTIGAVVEECALEEIAERLSAAPVSRKAA